MKGIIYPHNFTVRSVDRLLYRKLQCLDISSKEAGYIAYRIWHDFFMSSSDTRLIGDTNVKVEDTDLTFIIEEYCEWEGLRGSLVRSCIDSGFLDIYEKDGKNYLRCVDFFPLNQEQCSSKLTRKQQGPLKRGMLNRFKNVDQEVDQTLELFSQTKVDLIGQRSELDNKKCITFIRSIERVLRLEPNDNIWSQDIMNLADGILKKHTDADLEKTFIWLMSKNKDQSIPKRVDLIVNKFDEYVIQAGEDLV